jgi:hypothetical protein
MQEWFNICKSLNVIQHISRSKDKNHMIFSIDPEKALDKIQHHFMIKVLRKLGIEGMYLNIIKAIYITSVCQHHTKWGKTEIIASKVSMSLFILVFTFSTLILLVFLVRAIRQEKEITGVQIGRKEVKLSLFSGDVILYLKNQNISAMNSSIS